MIPSKLAVHPGARARLALAGGVLLSIALALAPGEWASSSLRAAAAAVAVGAAALLARTGKARAAAGPRLEVVARQPLARDVGVALVEIDGRAVLVGFGAGGVQLLEPVVTSESGVHAGVGAPRAARAACEGALP